MAASGAAAALGGGAIPGEWSDANQKVLVKLEREFRGRSHAQLLSRLRLELPGVPAVLIEARIEKLQRQRSYALRRRAMVAAWEARRGALVRSARQLLQELAESEGRLILKREERKQLDERRAELKSTLKVLEGIRAQREAEKAEQKAAEEERQAALDEAQRAKDEADRSHKKALLATYHQEQAAMAREAALAKLEEEEIKQAERVAQAEYNLKRVQHRIEMENEKRQAQIEKEEHERLLGEEHAMKLMRFHEKVLASLNVPDDPTRVFKDTAATAAQPHAKGGLFPVHGYADETLMKDVRFKLGHALRNAGIHDSDYARQMLNSKQFVRPSRPDAVVSNITFG